MNNVQTEQEIEEQQTDDGINIFDDEGETEFSKASTEEYAFLVKSEDRQYVLGPVLIPNRFDAQNDAFMPEVIEQTAHLFMKDRIAGISSMNVGHRTDREDIVIAESYILKGDQVVGNRRLPAGTWLLGAYLPDDLWADVKAGRLNGWSIHGPGRRVEMP